MILINYVRKVAQVIGGTLGRLLGFIISSIVLFIDGMSVPWIIWSIFFVGTPNLQYPEINFLLLTVYWVAFRVIWITVYFCKKKYQ